MSQMVILGEYGHGIGGPGITAGAARTNSIARMNGGDAGEPQWYDMYGSAAARSAHARPARPGRFALVRASEHLPEPVGRPDAVSSACAFRAARTKPSCGGSRCCRRPCRRAAAQAIYMANHVFGPAGLLEQDDGENWSHSTRGAKGAAIRERCR